MTTQRTTCATCDAGRVTPGQRLREVLNWLNGGTPAGLLIARSGHAELDRQADGIWTATRYEGIARRRPFTVGNVLLTRHCATELRKRPDLRRHEARHSTQWAVLGPLFVPLYVVAMLMSRILTGDTATGNAFEVHAGLRAGDYALRTRQRRAAHTPS